MLNFPMSFDWIKVVIVDAIHNEIQANLFISTKRQKGINTVWKIGVNIHLALTKQFCIYTEKITDVTPLESENRVKIEWTFTLFFLERL